MSAGRICSRVVVTATPAETIRTAAARMAEHDAGTLVVVDPVGTHAAIGILTDRDITIRGVAPGLDLEGTPISQLMTTPVHSVNEATPIEQALTRMASAATRRLVVTGDQGRPVGILSLDDVLDLLGMELESVGRLLEKQQPHLQPERPVLV